MGRRFRLLLGSVVLGSGLIVLLWPMWSVWRVSGQVLGELPSIEGTSIDDRRGLSAMADDDFVLATRTYPDLDPAAVAAGFVGFQASAVNGEVFLTKACCGGWDAVFVSLDDGPTPGSTVATVTVYDTDIQTLYPVIIVIGLLVVVLGLAIVGRVGRMPALPPLVATR